MSEVPSGYVSKCRCGQFNAAVDTRYVGREDVAKMLGEWIMRGNAVEPRFGDWSEKLGKCQCESKEASE